MTARTGLARLELSDVLGHGVRALAHELADERLVASVLPQVHRPDRLLQVREQAEVSECHGAPPFVEVILNTVFAKVARRLRVKLLSLYLDLRQIEMQTKNGRVWAAMKGRPRRVR